MHEGGGDWSASSAYMASNRSLDIQAFCAAANATRPPQDSIYNLLLKFERQLVRASNNLDYCQVILGISDNLTQKIINSFSSQPFALPARIKPQTTKTKKQPAAAKKARIQVKKAGSDATVHPDKITTQAEQTE
ncbi:Translin [Colletotrichum sp. SAR11_239]|nr:Translin [Colletotrichum sp. SAR11_239]